MKVKVLFLLFFLTAYLQAQEIGGLFFGINNITNSQSNSYNIKPQGISTGFYIPLNLKSKINVAFKFKACHHSAEFYSYGYYSNLENFLSVSNEFLLGYPFKIAPKSLLLPQIGIGAIGEAVYSDFDVGYTHGDFFLDLSLTATYKVGFCNLGVILNYEIDLMDQVDSMLSDQRLVFSLVVMK